MRKLTTVVALGLLLVVSAYAVEDNFTITVSVEWMSISLLKADSTVDYTNWDLGAVSAGNVSTMTTGAAGSHVLVDNNCNNPVDFSAYSTTVVPGACGYGTPTIWTPGAAAGNNIYRLEGGKSTVGALPGAWTNITSAVTPGNSYAPGEPAATNHRFYARFTAPTSVADGCTHTITVYIVAQ